MFVSRRLSAMNESENVWEIFLFRSLLYVSMIIFWMTRLIFIREKFMNFFQPKT